MSSGSTFAAPASALAKSATAVMLTDRSGAERYSPKGTHLPHLLFLPSLSKLDANPVCSPSSFKRNGP